MSLVKDNPEVGDLRVWWIPQVPMSSFEVDVPDIKTAKLVCEVLAAYDRFQFENRIKPDYTNAGGVSIYEDIGEEIPDWFDAYDEEGEDIW